jgi:peroxiredoxin
MFLSSIIDVGDSMADNGKTGKNSIDFSLQDQNSKTFTLSEHLGKRVLLSFHPLAWTSVCAMQMKSLEDNKANFRSLNSIAVGISVDSVPCKKAWSESLGIFGTSLWPTSGHMAEWRSFTAF